MLRAMKCSPAVPHEEEPPVTFCDDLGRQLAALGDTPSDDALTALAQRYSYVLPDDSALSILARVSPLIELGAGTGYWALQLRTRGVDIVAVDQAPPGGQRVNRYHPEALTWTDVITGDATLLTDYPDRTLFLCWPPLFSSLGDCLANYGGDTVALIGDGGHRTAALSGLNAAFTRIELHAVRSLDPMPGVPASLSIWRRAQ